MTLVEVIAGLAIFSLIVLFVMLILPSAIENVRINSEIKEEMRAAGAEIEQNISGETDEDDSADSSDKSEFNINFGSFSINSKGEYITTEDNNYVYFKYFLPE